jgi:hypothetical protein
MKLSFRTQVLAVALAALVTLGWAVAAAYMIGAAPS